MARTNKDLSDRTRAALLAAARDRFANVGYEATSTVEVANLAGTTRGALYHHFADKRALFQAVYVEVEIDVSNRVSGAVTDSGATDPLIAIAVALEAFLQSCVDRDVQQILLKDGLSVLGWEGWVGIESEHGLGQLVQMLERCQRSKVIADLDIVPLAHMILGAVMQAGLLMAASDNVEVALKSAVRSMRLLLEGTRCQPPQAQS